MADNHPAPGDALKLARILLLIALPLFCVGVFLGAHLIGKQAYLMPLAAPWMLSPF